MEPFDPFSFRHKVQTSQANGTSNVTMGCVHANLIECFWEVTLALPGDNPWSVYILGCTTTTLSCTTTTFSPKTKQSHWVYLGLFMDRFIFAGLSFDPLIYVEVRWTYGADALLSKTSCGRK